MSSALASGVRRAWRKEQVHRKYVRSSDFRGRGCGGRGGRTGAPEMCEELRLPGGWGGQKGCRPSCQAGVESSLCVWNAGGLDFGKRGANGLRKVGSL